MSGELTIRELDTLRRMRDSSGDDTELVMDGKAAFLGGEEIPRRVVFGLLRAAAIRLDQYSEVGKCERYTINDTGRELLRKAGR